MPFTVRKYVETEKLEFWYKVVHCRVRFEQTSKKEIAITDEKIEHRRGHLYILINNKLCGIDKM